MPPLSVILCTHNPRADYFHYCLSGLESQSLAQQWWELIVVDNASDASRAPRPDLSWHAHSSLIVEPTLGLTPARLCGIRAARGDLLVFVDDDNVLDPDFLETALWIAQERPFLGSWSGQCRPSFETPPADWTRRYWGNLVIREFEHDAWSNLPRLAESMPCGAGLCVRREVAQHYLRIHESGQRPFQLDRTGSSLLSGGDNDLAGCACDLGFGVGLIAALKLTHLIPAERLTEEYLTRLAEGIYFSSTILDAQRGAPLAPARGLTGQVVDWLRVIRLKPPHRAIARAAYRGRDRARRLMASAASPEQPG